MPAIEAMTAWSWHWADTDASGSITLQEFLHFCSTFEQVQLPCMYMCVYALLLTVATHTHTCAGIWVHQVLAWLLETSADSR